MEIIIACMLTFKYGQWEPFGDQLSVGIVIFSLAVLLLLFPLSYFMLFCHQSEVVDHDKEFNEAFGFLKKNLRQKTLAQRLYYIIMLARRFAYILIPLYAHDLPVIWQLTYLYGLSLMNLFYLAHCEPHDQRFHRKLLLINEYLVGACIICIFPTTDWNPETELKFHYSWLMIGMMQLLIVINMYTVLSKTFRILVLLNRKFKKTSTYLSLKQRF